MNKNRLVQITRRSKIAEDEFYPMIAFMYEQVWQNLLPTQILTEGLTTRAANNVITPVDAPIPDCMTCGACCASMLCVGVRPDEDKEISAEDYWDIVVKGENGEILVDRYLQRNAETFACTALDGTIGEKVGCRIYENRPDICHLFEAGSDKCRALRRAYGLEPFLTLLEMSEAVQKLKMLPEKNLPSERIRHVKFVEQSEDELEISAAMNDGTVKTIHVFNPKRETWRQFEFDGLTLSEAENLIKSRIPEASEKSGKI
ncbi:MAG: YkgJ family cysteine cluster protein [Pyrinomonadaceae bacterium]